MEITSKTNFLQFVPNEDVGPIIARRDSPLRCRQAARRPIADLAPTCAAQFRAGMPRGIELLPEPRPRELSAGDRDQVNAAVACSASSETPSAFDVLIKIGMMMLKSGLLTLQSSQAAENSQGMMQIKQDECANKLLGQETAKRFDAAITQAAIGVAAGLVTTVAVGLSARHGFENVKCSHLENEITACAKEFDLDMPDLLSQVKALATGSATRSKAWESISKALDTTLNQSGSAGEAVQTAQAGGLKVQGANAQTRASEAKLIGDRSAAVKAGANALNAAALEFMKQMLVDGSTVNQSVNKMV